MNETLARSGEKQFGTTTKVKAYLYPWVSDVAQYTSAEDASVLTEGRTLDGEKATAIDYTLAGVGLFVPFTSGGAVKKLAKASNKAETVGKTVKQGWNSLRGTAKNSKWMSPKQGIEGPDLRDHFAKHGDQVGAKTAREYDLSSRLTIQNGRKFSYRDPSSNARRVGYWDESTGLFTGTSQTRGNTTIMTHYPLSWEKTKKLPGFSSE